MASDVIIKSYHIKHRLCLNSLLESAKQIADYAVANKANKKLLTSKYVKHFGLPSAVSNQILRKYGRGTMPEAINVNLFVPSHSTVTLSKISEVVHQPGKMDIVTLSYQKRYLLDGISGRDIERINQVEIRIFLSESVAVNISE